MDRAQQLAGPGLATADDCDDGDDDDVYYGEEVSRPRLRYPKHLMSCTIALATHSLHHTRSDAWIAIRVCAIRDDDYFCDSAFVLFGVCTKERMIQTHSREIFVFVFFDP